MVHWPDDASKSRQARSEASCGDHKEFGRRDIPWLDMLHSVPNISRDKIFLPYISTSSGRLGCDHAAVMVALNFFPLAGAISFPFLRGFLGSDVVANDLARRDFPLADADAGSGDGHLNLEDVFLTTTVSTTS